jgi:hypothetical protein
MPTGLITNAAVPLFAAAVGNATSVEVTHIALGDGNGAGYAPSAAQTSLVNERLRIPIENRRFLAPQRWRVVAEVAADTPAFSLRELGFFAADGTMIGIWAGADVAVRPIGVTAYRVFYHLDLSAAPEGSVVIEADNDDFYRHTLTDLESHGVLGDEQIKQRLLVRDLTRNLKELTVRVAALEA